MSSRKYLKRVWRVPKDRGASEYLATLVVKALRKHGWPANAQMLATRAGFLLLHHEQEQDHPPDFGLAVSAAVRIVSRTYRVDVSESMGVVTFNRSYRVASGGHFSEVKPDE